MLDERILWVWLSLKFIPGKSRIKELLECFGGIRGIYDAKSYDRMFFLSGQEKMALMDKDLDAAYDVCRKAKAAGMRIIVFGSRSYPLYLMNTNNPPYVLYVKGRIPDWNSLFTIGAVGTRRASDYGVRITKKIVSGLVNAGVTIVTGLARGLDTVAANEAAVRGAFFIGVIGSGIDVVYPSENRQLFEATARFGLLISEYPPGTPPLGSNFPIRNRIIAGLSNGVLVTEAPKKSGALITAMEAVRNGRDLFSVPGDVFKYGQEGTNKLLQMGAKCVSCAEDILEDYPYAKRMLTRIESDVFADESISGVPLPGRVETPVKTPDTSVLDKLPEEERALAKLMADSEKHIDELVRESGMEPGRVRTMMTMLEMDGIVRSLPGNKYKLKEN